MACIILKKAVEASYDFNCFFRDNPIDIASDSLQNVGQFAERVPLFSKIYVHGILYVIDRFWGVAKR